MGLLKLVRAAITIAAGSREEESLDPTDGGLNVHITGGTVAQAGLAPPTGATIAGDDAAHALGALTGAGHVVIAAAGGTVRIGSAGTPPTSSTGFPVLAGASYDWQALAVEGVRIYVPAGVTAIWGAHQ